MKKKCIISVSAAIYFFLLAALVPVRALAAEGPVLALSSQVNGKVVTVNVRQVALDEILLALSKQTGVAFGYQEGVIDKNQKFSLQVNGT